MMTTFKMAPKDIPINSTSIYAVYMTMKINLLLFLSHQYTTQIPSEDLQYSYAFQVNFPKLQSAHTWLTCRKDEHFVTSFV